MNEESCSSSDESDQDSDEKKIRDLKKLAIKNVGVENDNDNEQVFKFSSLFPDFVTLGPKAKENIEMVQERLTRYNEIMMLQNEKIAHLS